MGDRGRNFFVSGFEKYLIRVEKLDIVLHHNWINIIIDEKFMLTWLKSLRLSINQGTSSLSLCHTVIKMSKLSLEKISINPNLKYNLYTRSLEIILDILE